MSSSQSPMTETDCGPNMLLEVCGRKYSTLRNPQSDSSVILLQGIGHFITSDGLGNICPIKSTVVGFPKWLKGFSMKIKLT